MINTLSALVLTVGASVTLPVADDAVTGTYPSVYVQIAPAASQGYLWASTSVDESVYVLGQRMHRDTNPSIGVGYTFPVTTRFNVYAEAGYKFRGDGYYPFANSEIAYTYLVGRHNVEGRPIPLDLGPNGNADVFEHGYTYDIDNSVMFNVGIEADITDSLSMRFGYTVERADVLWEIYEPERKQEWDSTGGDCTKQCGYWMEYDVLRSDGFTFSLQYSF